MQKDQKTKRERTIAKEQKISLRRRHEQSRIMTDIIWPFLKRMIKQAHLVIFQFTPTTFKNVFKENLAYILWPLKNSLPPLIV